MRILTKSDNVYMCTRGHVYLQIKVPMYFLKEKVCGSGVVHYVITKICAITNLS